MSVDWPFVPHAEEPADLNAVRATYGLPRIEVIFTAAEWWRACEEADACADAADEAGKDGEG